MAQATRSTAWVKTESGAEKRVRWIAGYDCRVVCPHDRPGNHGQSGDELTLDVRSVDAAVSMTLFTWARDGLEDQTGSKEPVKPGWLHLHFGFVFDESDVRVAAPSVPCDVLESGKCWSSEADCSPGVAREIWEASQGDRDLIGKEVASPKIEAIVLYVARKLWSGLERHMKEQREKRWNEHLALPLQCDKCHGSGLVPRLS